MSYQQNPHPDSVAGTIERSELEYRGIPLADMWIARVLRLYRNERGDPMFVALGWLTHPDRRADLEIRVRGVFGDPQSLEVVWCSERT